MTISKQCEALISLQSSSWVVISVGKEEKRLVSESWGVVCCVCNLRLVRSLACLLLGYYCGHSKVGKGTQHERNACGIHFGFLHTVAPYPVQLYQPDMEETNEGKQLLGALF